MPPTQPAPPLALPDSAATLLQLCAPSAHPTQPPAVEWGALLALAERHALLPLLHARLAPLGSALPNEAQQRLREAHRSSAARAMFFEWELRAVVAAFEAASIPLIVFKGIPLARQLYGDPSVRPMVDLDVLVRADALERGTQLLLAHGWAAQHDWTIHRDFVKEVGGFPLSLELHWTSQREGEYDLPEATLWAEAAPTPEGWLFSPEMTLLALVLHAERHSFASFRQFVDIAHALACWNETLAWPRLEALARAAKAWPLLALVLALACRDLSAPLPRHAPLRAAMQGPRVRLGMALLSAPRLLAPRPFKALYRYGLPLLIGAWKPLHLPLVDVMRTPAQVAYIYRLPRNSPRAWLLFALRPALLLGKYLRHLVAKDNR